MALHGFCIVNCFFGIGFVLALGFGKLACGGTSNMQFDLSAYFWQTGWFNHPPKKEVGIFVLPKPLPTGYFLGFLTCQCHYSPWPGQVRKIIDSKVPTAWEGDVMWSFPGGYLYPWICLVGDFLRILPWQITIFHHHLGHIFTFSNHLKEIQAVKWPYKWVSLGYFTLWVFPKIGVPQNGWFIMENPILSVFLFQ